MVELVVQSLYNFQQLVQGLDVIAPPSHCSRRPAAAHAAGDHPRRHHPAAQLSVMNDVITAGAAEHTTQERQRALNA